VEQIMSKSYEGWGKYVGDWKYGTRHGNGTFTTADGSSYTGTFKNGLEHGSGTCNSSSGTRYEGEWSKGKYHGEGMLTTSDGFKYEGEFKNGKPWSLVKYDDKGNTVEIIFTGATYQGDMEDNMPHGQGTMTFPNGDKYVGHFVCGEKHGYGKLTTLGGCSEYVGGFNKGKRSGKGVEFTVHDGYGTWTYQGEFKDDKPHGLGTETWGMTDDAYTDSVYEGEFMSGVKHGHGELVRGNGEKFVGEFRDHEEWEGKVYDEQGNLLYSVTEGEHRI
jgi:hypothetical protein